MSGSRKGELQDGSKGQDSHKEAAGSKKTRKPRATDVGRALRSVYDDTLRETVPGDFLDLLGKLS